MTTGALTGITVLDMTRVMSGPYCTLMLADMGARVIKVERPGRGDDTRAWGPPFIGGESAYFLSVNRNKESLTLDFKLPEGRRILDALVDRADVLVENFRPGTLERLGLDYASLATRVPRLIHASISGYGQTGPLAHLAGIDAVAQAEGGLMSVTGDADGTPFRLGLPISDLVSGLFASQGILLALLQRATTGLGQQVDIAMHDAVAALLTYHGSVYLATGDEPSRQGNGHGSIVPYDTFDTRDGQFVLAIGNDDQWRRFCAVADLAVLAVDARFATNPQRVAHRDQLQPIVARVLRTRDRADWAKRLRETGIPCGPVRTVGEAIDDPQLQARGMIGTVHHPTAGALRLVGSPIKLSGATSHGDRPPPTLGEHTGAILTQDLGYTEAQVTKLRERGVV